MSKGGKGYLYWLRKGNCGLRGWRWGNLRRPRENLLPELALVKVREILELPVRKYKV